jgi:DNA-binding IscR family transcriptional regulator
MDRFARWLRENRDATAAEKIVTLLRCVAFGRAFPPVRVQDISRWTGINEGAVSVALGQLRKRGFVEKDQSAPGNQGGYWAAEHDQRGDLL